LELFLTPLKYVYLFRNLSTCMLFFSCNSSLLLIFFLRHLV
jgi:hypothetical protein